MQNISLDDIKQLLEATIGQSEARIMTHMNTSLASVRQEMAKGFAAVRGEMADGFAGIADIVEQIHDDNTATNKRITKLEHKIA